MRLLLQLQTLTLTLLPFVLEIECFLLNNNNNNNSQQQQQQQQRYHYHYHHTNTRTAPNINTAVAATVNTASTATVAVNTATATATATATNNNHETNQNTTNIIGPLLISIGPPCSNKKEAIETYLRLSSMEYEQEIMMATTIVTNDSTDDVDDDSISDSDDNNKEGSTNDHNIIQQQQQQHQQKQQYHEVNLRDNSKGVYHRIPVAAFLYPSTHLSKELGNAILYDIVRVRDRLLDFDQNINKDHPDTTHGPRNNNRNNKNTDTEIRNVMLRLAGRITSMEFATRMKMSCQQAGDTIPYFKKRRHEVTEDLISAVEEVVVDIIGEVLVQMNMNHNMNTISTTTTMDTNSQQQQQQQQQNGKQTRTMIEDDAQEDNNNKDNDNEELPYGEEIEEDNDDDNETAKTVADLVSLMNNTTSAHLLSARALIKTPYVELYVPQCIFSDGITRAEQQLQQPQTSTSSTIPIVWRNTNTRPSEYVIALEAAQQAHRPVKFIWWGMKMNIEMNDNDANDCDSSDAVLVDIMPTVSRKELLKRNIQHFRHTGRYIPAGAIGGSLDRIENLLHTADKIATKAAATATATATAITTTTITDTAATTSSSNTSSSSLKGNADDDNHDDNQKLLQQQQQLMNTNKMMDRAFAYLGGFHINTETGLVTKVNDCKQLRQPFSYRTNSSRTSRSTKPIKRKKKQKQYTENRGKVK